MIDIRELSPGMQVKVVDVFTDYHYDDCYVVGGMEQWLGQTVTVKYVIKGKNDDFYDSSIFIEEDAEIGPVVQGGHFYWHIDCFECIVEEDDALSEIDSGRVLDLFV